MAAIVNPTLKQVISDFAYIFEDNNQIPVLEDTITFDTGSVNTSEVKLTTKQVVTATLDKDDSDISYDEVVSLDFGAEVTDGLGAEKTENIDVTFVTRSKNAKVELTDATVSSSYQYSDDGVLVKHKVITPSAAGMKITVAASGQQIQAPTA